MLLSSGANPSVANADGVTPFQASLIKLSFLDDTHHQDYRRELEELLIRMLKSHGKDLMTGNMGVKIMREFLPVLDYNYRELLRQLLLEFDREMRYEELGLSRLQVGCAIGDHNVIKAELESEADVNARISFDSPLWPGDTALHILLRKTKRPDDDQLVELLLAHGADFTLKNAKNQTPFHLNQDYLSQQDTFLLKYNFASVNPINDEGLSHFHISCLKYNKTLIEEFLKSGVDVNACVEYFDKQYAGYTPLHFAAKYMDCDNTEVIELLLDYGADPNISDADGLNPWHLALMYNLEYDNRIKALLRCPKIDIYNTSKFTGTALDTIFRCYMDFGMVVRNNILRIIQWGYELCYKDEKGKTVLHKTTNPNAIMLLLSMGADVNIKDDEGKTPCIQYISAGNYIIKPMFIEHLQLLEFAGLYIDNLNKIGLGKSYGNFQLLLEKHNLNVALKNKINSSFSVDYFFSQKFVVDYKKMPKSYREKINNFCSSNDFSNFEKLSPIIMLQFGKARARTRMFKLAEIAYQTLIDKYIPDCFDFIFDYLNNDDVMNLIRAGNGRLEFAPLSENY